MLESRGPSDGRWAETTDPLVANWEPGADRSRFAGTALPRGDVDSRDAALAFRLGEPGSSRGDGDYTATVSRPRAEPSPPRRSTPFPAIGGIVGGFRILSELGRGAFARVYLAEQSDLSNRPVALKVAEALGDEPQALARLQHTNIVPIYSVHDDPATGLRLLCMPYVGGANLAQVLERSGGANDPARGEGASLLDALDDVGGRVPTRGPVSRIDPGGGLHGPFGAASGGIGSPTAVRSVLGRYWARMPWWKSLVGASDADAVPEPAAVEERDQPARRYYRSHTYIQAAVWIGARLAEGLDHAHQRGILHRDLKPSNILIAEDGTPMLLDFNLAADSGATPPEEGGERAMIGGTLPYMAPEHLDAFNPNGTTDASAVDERSDLYAMGLILFEMVAGRHPFDEPPGGLPILDLVARMTAERRRGAPPARAFNPAVPPSLDAILTKCLHPDPSRRYRGAAELAEDLQRFLDDRPNAHAPEPSPRERAAKWWRRHPEVRGAGPVLALSVALLAGLGATAWSLSGSAEAARARLKREEFREKFRECQLLLNTTSARAEHREKGIALADNLLALYGADGPAAWASGPLVRRLAPAEQSALREEISELMLLLARARVARTARGATEPRTREALEGAVTLLDRVEAIDPHPSAALFETRARYLAALGEADKARRDRDRADRLPPFSARDYYLRGTARAAAGQIDGAEMDLGRAVAMDPKRFWAWFVLGLCHLDSGQFAEAAGDFSACTLLAPDFDWPHLNRGLALARAGRLAEARYAYDRALALNPNSVEGRVDRALVLLELNDPVGAEADLARALARGPRTAALLAARAEALARSGRRLRAEEEFAEALKVRPGDPDVLIARGVMRISVDPPGAAQDFRAVLARDPKNARALYGLALLLRHAEPDSALAHVRTSLEVDPGSIDALRLRAVLLGRKGDPAAAADAEALARRPSAHNLYNAACALALLDAARQTTEHRDQAREYLRRALALGFPAKEAEADPDLESLRR